MHIIDALYLMNIAHLDIRLENTCIKLILSPILIDPDRSRKTHSRPPADLMYGKSQMYNVVQQIIGNVIMLIGDNLLC